jgi:hypothetical protein
MSVFKGFFKYLLVFSVALIGLLCISTWGQGAVYYLTTNGDNSNPGTETKPWLTLQKAANTMVAGDTVYVKQGTYSGFMVSTSGTADNYISYLAYPGATPIIGQIYFGNGASYNKFYGFEITYPSGGGVQMNHNNDYNIVSNCHIHHCNPGGSVGVDLSGGSDFNIVEDCIIHDCYYAIHTSESTNRGNIFRRNVCYRISDDGFNFSPSTEDTQVINNVIYDVGWDGSGGADGIHLFDDGTAIVRGNLVYLDSDSTGGVFWIHGGTNHIVENNTFVGLPGFSASFGGIVCIELSANVILKNNIGYSSSGSVGVVTGIDSSTNDDYNDWYNASDPSMCVRYGGEWKSVSDYQSQNVRGLHCISQDAKFVDFEHGDFHLRPDSPCIGTGENGVDMGAYGAGESVPVYDDPEEPVYDDPEEPVYDDPEEPVYDDPTEPDSSAENPPETESQSDGVDAVHNQPNPFRAGREETLIKYDLEQPSNVTITIYDLLGQEVWQENYRSGENGGKEDNSVPWDGRNLSGKVVANGGYFCRIWVEKEKRHMLRKIAVAK